MLKLVRQFSGLAYHSTPPVLLCVCVNSYLVGTEEGHIHRCSCSYNEQYLDSYFGHTVCFVCWIFIYIL